MSSYEIQSLIKNNTEEIQDYLRDLKYWETDIKLEDLKLSENGCSYSEEAFPIRGQSATCKIVAEKRNMKQIEKKKPVRILSCDYEAWDKFDVDKALRSENEEESPQKFKNKIDTSGDIKDNMQREKVAHREHDSLESVGGRDRAERLKEEGNRCYAEGKLSDAIAKYTQGIGLNPSNALLPANRAMAYIKLKKYEAAETDCTKALSLDPTYIKAYLRRATARAFSANIEGAIEDYEKVLSLEPWNKDAKRELEKLEDQNPRLRDVVPPLEDAPRPSPAQSCQQVKKMKVAEMDSKMKSETSTQLPSLSKTIQQKAAVRIPVIEVSSREKLEELIGEAKLRNRVKSAADEHPVSGEKVHPVSSEKVHPVSGEKEVQTPSVPKPPKTSHQLSQDWHRIREHHDLRRHYLKKDVTDRQCDRSAFAVREANMHWMTELALNSIVNHSVSQSIDLSFFYGTEIETDLLLEIFTTLLGDEFEAEFAATFLAALMTSRGFFLNLAFFDAQQKRVLEKMIEKMEKCDFDKEKMEQLRVYL